MPDCFLNFSVLFFFFCFSHRHWPHGVLCEHSLSLVTQCKLSPPLSQVHLPAMEHLTAQLSGICAAHKVQSGPSVKSWGYVKNNSGILGSCTQSRASIPMEVLRATLAIKGQYPCGGLQGYIKAMDNTPEGFPGASLAVKSQHPNGSPQGCTYKKPPTALWGSRGFWLLWATTPKEVLTAALSQGTTPLSVWWASLAVKGQHPNRDPRSCTDQKGQTPLWGLEGCIDSYGPAPQWRSWGLHWVKGQHPSVSEGHHWQSRASTPLETLGVALIRKGQHPCGGLEGCIDSYGPASMWGPGELHWVQGQNPWVSQGHHWQSRASTPIEILRAAPTRNSKHLCGGLEDCIDSYGPASV